ncbi:MAG: hypothetical protein J2P20_02340 [Pseudonocardia sp.]|nr:hypothetical protein [Pseudonocardia sp.]MBO0872589.1 hypothetical protein [Pseudonocardia sp.]
MTAPADPAVPRAALSDARDRSGQSIDAWTAAALAAADGPVLELGGAPTDPARFVTLRRPGSSGAACGRAELLPVASGALAGVRATLCLPTLLPLDALFAELRRVLRPTGTLVAVAPSRPSLPERRAWRPLHAALGGRPQFRHESVRDRLGWLFAAADFAVLTDTRRTFWLPVPDQDTAVRTVAALAPNGIWPPGLPPDRLRLAAEALARSAAPGYRLPVALRLVVGRR